MLHEKIFIVTILTAFIVTLIFTKYLIKYLKTKNIKQKILEEGPSWHKKKEGTPTMGGIAMIFASFVAFLIVCVLFGKNLEKRELMVLLNTFVFAVTNGFVGVVDDLAKIRKRKNEGLTPKGKIVFQSIIAVVYLMLMKVFADVETKVFIPYFDVEIELGILYYVLAFFLLCGMVNAVNLTDGLDGLASLCVLSVGLFLTFCGVAYGENAVSSFSGAILVGTATAFLFYNLHPARIFMGDTGSLFLGGIVVASGFALNNPLLVLIYGFVFVFEALSVILQVAFFKISKGKRIFKMAPFHHHLEKCGISEMKVVCILGLANLLFCVLACFGLR